VKSLTKPLSRHGHDWAGESTRQQPRRDILPAHTPLVSPDPRHGPSVQYVSCWYLWAENSCACLHAHAYQTGQLASQTDERPFFQSGPAMQVDDSPPDSMRFGSTYDHYFTSMAAPYPSNCFSASSTTRQHQHHRPLPPSPSRKPFFHVS
jgi:hypothetical protein